MRVFLFIISVLLVSSCYCQICETGSFVVDCGFETQLTQGRSNLSNFDSAISDLSSCPNVVNIALIGDSNTNNKSRFYQPLKAKTDDSYEIMPTGFTGFQAIDRPNGIQLGASASDWNISTNDIGLDGGSATSLGVGSTMSYNLVYTVQQALITDKILIFYEKQPNGGDFDWRSERASIIEQSGSVSTIGTGLGVVTISGLSTTGTGTMKTIIDVTSQNTDGVKILGFVATTDILCGVIWHKLGRGGWRASTWEPIISNPIYQQQLLEIGFDLISVSLGTNDTNDACAFANSSMQSITDILSNYADLMLMPPVVKVTNLNCSMAEIEAFQKQLAFTEGYGLVNIYRNFGISSDCVTEIYGYDGSHYTNDMVSKNISLICEFLGF